MLDGIGMSDVAADVAAVADFLAADTTDVLAAEITDVLSAAKAASGVLVQQEGHRSKVRPTFNSKANVQ